MNADPPRVLIIGPTPPPFHGVATFIRDLLNSPAHFRAFCLDHLDTSDRRDASNLGRWDAGNLALGFANLADLTGLLRRRRHAVVYIPISQNIPAFLRDALFILHARAFGARVVLQLHGGYFREFYDRESPGWFRIFARWIFNRASAVVVLSGEFTPIFEGLVPSDRIHIVENGVPDLFADDAPESLDSRPPETLLYMSTLARAKGFVDLIHALPRIRASFPNARLRLAGNCSEPDGFAEVRAFIEAENLSGAVDFVGTVNGPAKREFLLSGSLFCLPTHYRYEGQPLAILEAMSAGLPVLSTRQGAIGSTVLDGTTGHLVTPGASPQEIADAAIALLANRPRLQALGQAARDRYCNHFTLKKCHQKLAAIFEHPNSQKRPAPEAVPMTNNKSQMPNDK